LIGLRAKAMARTLAPLLLLWLAVHAVLLLLIAVGFGLVVLLKAVIGWTAHLGAILLLAVGGAWLLARYMRITPKMQSA
jgi:hypothetical protein